MYKALAFDLDGTLAESKQPLPGSVAYWFRRLCTHFNLLVISGCSFKQMKEQVIDQLGTVRDPYRLTFMPISGSQMYNLGDNTFEYDHSLLFREKVDIYNHWRKACEAIGLFPPEKTYGEVAEDREGQITFSMCGQEAPLAVKEAWQLENDTLRHKVVELMNFRFNGLGYQARAGGTTSIDVSKVGRDKAYGLQQYMNAWGFEKKDILFFGDKFEVGENDRPVLDMGIDCIMVKNYYDTCEQMKRIYDEYVDHGVGRV